MMPHRFIRLLLCFFLLIFHCSPAAAQSAAKYKEIDAFIKADQLKVESPADIKVFGRELKRLFPEDEIKARAAFFWLTQHIKYDCEGYRSGNMAYEPVDVLAKGRAVCSGFARLMKMFCDELGVECVEISGFATGISVDKVNPDSLVSNHTWNAVKIKGQWKLVDPTWGRGYSNNDCTESWQVLKNEYFLADPAFMISSHFPEEAKWQLLDKPYTARDFADSIVIRKRAGNNGVLPDSLIKKGVGEFLFIQLFHTKKFEHIQIQFADQNSDSVFYTINDEVVQDQNGYYRYTCPLNRAGKFKLNVWLINFSGDDPVLVRYLLEVKSKSGVPAKAAHQ